MQKLGMSMSWTHKACETVLRLTDLSSGGFKQQEGKRRQKVQTDGENKLIGRSVGWFSLEPQHKTQWRGNHTQTTEPVHRTG